VLSFNINPLNAELNPICHFVALLGAHPILHVSGVRVKTESDKPKKFKLVLHFINSFNPYPANVENMVNS